MIQHEYQIINVGQIWPLGFEAVTHSTLEFLVLHDSQTPSLATLLNLQAKSFNFTHSRTMLHLKFSTISHIWLFLQPFICNARLHTQLIYQYPSLGTWIENAAVRSNGDILLTSIENPGGLSILDPFDSSAPTILTNDFNRLNSTLGIVETYPDVYWVIASNFSLDPATMGAQPHTNAIFKATFDDCNGRKDVRVSTSLLTNIPEAKVLNGLTKFNNTFLLASDSGKGLVWGINTETGHYQIMAQDPLMKPKPFDGFAEGINGLHFRKPMLYFSNTQQHLFASVKLDQHGFQHRPAVKIATPVIEGNVNPGWDDFAIDRDGEFSYIATEAGNTIQRIGLHTGDINIVAGDLNSTAIAEPTSAVFGRTLEDCDVLYALTAGGLADPVYTKKGPKQFGAQVVAVDLGKLQR